MKEVQYMIGFLLHYSQIRSTKGERPTFYMVRRTALSIKDCSEKDGNIMQEED
jgi:hypothetical protein